MNRVGGRHGTGQATLDPSHSTQIELQVDATAEAVKTRFLQFLCNYNKTNPASESPLSPSSNITAPPRINYSHQAEIMRHTETSSLFVDFTHILDYDGDLAAAIQAQYYRWEPYLRQAVFNFIRMEDASYTINDDNANQMNREFFVCLYNFQYVSRIRELKACHIGQLVSFCGTVTRTSDVRPELLIGAFTCLECGGETTGITQQFKYSEPIQCANPYCSNTFAWTLSTHSSVFVDWQRLKVQENSDEIPPGAMPRSIDVILRHENVEQAKAGDRVVFTGTFIVVPDVGSLMRATGDTATIQKQRTNGPDGNNATGGVRGLKALGVRELTYKTTFLACSVQTMEQRFNRTSIRTDDHEDDEDDEEEEEEDADDINEGDDEEENNGTNIVHNFSKYTKRQLQDFSQLELERIAQMARDPDKYDKMARTICPSVYGHDEIRKGILLMLFGGVHKRTRDQAMTLRGDINICIVGDPSTAKSQFLKYIVEFLPRAIYTSGKVSSAAGLTASVSRDPETGDFCVEAGALMLADNGICCIDEFDKMDNADQVAIHEAMEQQTISITKAGIQATMNARTSILAAANPISGRYDKTKTLKYNVNISAPIMSRFDLFFVIVDECDENVDAKIANHIVELHLPPMLQESSTPNHINPHNKYTEDDLKRYIKFARSIHPIITERTKARMVQCYRQLRENDVMSNGKSNIAYRITVRQLESMIRLSEALARCDLSEYVTRKHVNEAYRLLSQSIIHVDIEKINFNDYDADENMDDENMEENSSRNNDNDGMSFEQYASIQKAICWYIKEQEETEGDTFLGIRQAELMTWYLASQDIASENQLVHEKKQIQSVIEKLLHDKIIAVAEDTGEEDVDMTDDTADTSDAIAQRYLKLHPNYSID